MILNNNQVNSENALIDELYKLSDAGASLIQIRTQEPLRTMAVLRKSILASDGNTLREWDEVNGARTFTVETCNNIAQEGDASISFDSAINAPLQDLRNKNSPVRLHPDKLHYYMFLDPHKFMGGNPHYEEMLIQYSGILPSANACLIFITEMDAIDGLPPGTIQVVDMNTPSAEELRDALVRILDSAEEDFDGGSELTDEDILSLAYLGLGLTLYEFETYAAISIIDAHGKGHEAITLAAMSAGIAQGKTSVVKRSDILELTQNVDMKDVGGMQRLKDWAKARKTCFSQEAGDFGITAPKGAALVGVPGTGKSLIAKAIAAEFGIPLIKFDVSRVFSKYIGDSESRIRSALKMVEDMSPCVLFIDEIDKGLGGAGSGGGDNGTSSRVLGTFLTWLQENKSPVFSIVTANSVGGLPPELLRRGRFDKVFSVGMPTPTERIDVLNIHLRKRNHTLKFTQEELRDFTAASEGYVPAEIEAVVGDALIAAFNAKQKLTMAHVIDALKDMVPMSTSNKTKIDAIVEWARTNATPVSYEDEATRVVNMVASTVDTGQRRIRTSRKE